MRFESTRFPNDGEAHETEAHEASEIKSTEAEPVLDRDIDPVEQHGASRAQPENPQSQFFDEEPFHFGLDPIPEIPDTPLPHSQIPDDGPFHFGLDPIPEIPDTPLPHSQIPDDGPFRFGVDPIPDISGVTQPALEDEEDPTSQGS